MEFKDAKKLLDSKVPIIHEKYGIIYSTSKKESFFINVGEGMLQKVIIDNIDNIWIYQPERFTTNYSLITSLDAFKLTKDWKPYIGKVLE